MKPCGENCHHVRNGRKAAESGQLARARANVDPEHIRSLGKIMGRKHAESGHLAKIAGMGGRKNAEAGNLIRIASLGGRAGARITNAKPEAKEWRVKAWQAARSKPTWPEAVFYGLVYGYDWLSEGFTAQQYDGHGIYDGAWPGVVIEFDGGGHHAFQDRHERDAKKDRARRLNGNIVLRETDINVLFLKILALRGGGNG